MRRNKPKLKPVEAELCRLIDEDGDLFIVYKDNTAVYDREDAKYIQWEIRETDGDQLAFFYSHDNLKTFQTDFKPDDDFEIDLVEAIQMAIITEEIDEALSNSINKAEE